MPINSCPGCDTRRNALRHVLVDEPREDMGELDRSDASRLGSLLRLLLEGHNGGLVSRSRRSQSCSIPYSAGELLASDPPTLRKKDNALYSQSRRHLYLHENTPSNRKKNTIKPGPARRNTRGSAQILPNFAPAGRFYLFLTNEEGGKPKRYRLERSFSRYDFNCLARCSNSRNLQIKRLRSGGV